MPKIYITDLVMVNGEVALPGDVLDLNENDVAAILSAGRGSLDAVTGKAAGKQFAAQQTAADQAAA
jgi:hypothetical protein